jgi:hypothetical protein
VTPTLTRDDDHVYRLAGRRYSGVTEIIAGLGLAMDLSFLDPFYRRRGSAVHAAIALHFQGHEIDWGFLGAEEVCPRFDRAVRLAEAAGMVPILCEEMMVSTTYAYAGQLDYFGPFYRHPFAVVDYKGDGHDPLGHRLQIAAYKGLLLEKAARKEIPATVAEVMAAPCYIVPLGGDSDLPRPIPICDPDGHDVALFRGAAALWNFKLSIRGEQNASA